jgi:alpha-ketoglutarate-dependent taurine dioxygenase
MPLQLGPGDSRALGRSSLAEALLDRGAVLFRGLPVEGVDDFQRFFASCVGDPLPYEEQSSPRSRVDGHVYTSTDYPPEWPIFLHNELSYSSRWPMKLAFYCDVPAASGGETPIASTRAITQAIDPEIRARFAEKQVLYVRNLGQGVGLHWSQVFGSSDRAMVETTCRDAAIDFEWRADDVLRTRQVRPALRRHPDTGEPLWFNHATFFHVSTLEPAVRDVLLSAFGPEGVPTNTFYGDGSPIEDDVLAHLRSVYEQNKVTFPWRRGDVLVIDNMLVSHGRAAYRGSRRTLVAMADSRSDEDATRTRSCV